MVALPTRLAYVVSHPIQYQAPLLRMIADSPAVELTVFFASDFSTRTYMDTGFGASVSWDVPLTEGYNHVFLEGPGSSELPTRLMPWNTGLRDLLKRDRFDALWVHGYTRPTSLRSLLIAKRRGIKTFLRDEATDISAQRSVGKRFAKKIFFAGLDPLVDAYLAIGTLNAAYYTNNGVSDSKIHSMPYAVDNSFFRERVVSASKGVDRLKARLGIEHGRPVVLYAGKLQQRKRVDDLIKAFKELYSTGYPRQPYLLIVGDGEMFARLTELGAELPPGVVQFLGFKNQTELPELYALADVFVLPSEREPWGLVVNEVMNAGCAVIVSDQVGCGPDLVIDGENGFQYATGDVAHLAECLRKVLMDPSVTSAFGSRSLQRISEWGLQASTAGLVKALSLVVSAKVT